MAALRAEMAAVTRVRDDFSRYGRDPTGFAEKVLGITFLWQPIADAIRLLLIPPYVVDIDSGHNVGKSHAAALTLLWWLYCRGPCVVLSTAPTQRDVEDILWAEVRLMHRRAADRLPDYFVGPSAPQIHVSADHWAKGYTARKGESFQGRHRRHTLLIFDEKEGVDLSYWTAAKTMFRPGSGDAWLRIGNPTTTTSVAYQERRKTLPDGSPAAHLVRLSALDHPNVAAGLRGDKLPVPSAVTHEQVAQWVADWTEPLAVGENPRPTDIMWPPEQICPCCNGTGVEP